MKKNNKGFMLAEVIITSTVVVTAMIALYAGINRVYNNYRTRASYYNLDATYATKSLINSMMINYNTDTININSFISDTFHGENYKYLINNNTCVAELNLPSSCESIKKLYGVDNMLFVEYDKETLSNLKNNISNQTFRDYIDYVITYYNIGATEEVYNYILLTEIKDGDNYYYANLRMR